MTNQFPNTLSSRPNVSVSGGIFGIKVWADYKRFLERTRNDKMRALFIVISLAISYLSFVIAPVMAQDIVGPITAPNTVVRDISQTGSFISAIIRFITVIAGVWALWQFLTGGFAYISSSGDKAKVQQGMQQIMMAITGLAIIGASFIIAAVVGRILFGPSFNILSPTLQSVQ